MHKQPAQPSEEPESSQSEGTQLQQQNDPLRNILVSALAIADFVTRASKNEVTSWRKPSGSERSGTSSSRTTEPEGTDVEEVEDEGARKEEVEIREADVETVEKDAAKTDEGAETTEDDGEPSNQDGEAQKEARSNDGSE